jgi:hypothetical protein
MTNNLLTHTRPVGYLVDRSHEQFSLPFREGDLVPRSKAYYEKVLNLDHNVIEFGFATGSKYDYLGVHKNITNEWLVHYISEFNSDRIARFSDQYDSMKNEWVQDKFQHISYFERQESKFIISNMSVGRLTVALSVVFITLFVSSILLSGFSLFHKGEWTDLASVIMVMVGSIFGLLANKRAMGELKLNDQH